ncbi:MAG: serine protease [Polyangiaceae bacterium]|nr:serine protease [Myxococcales bacterium]MCB9585339.1 serine protease [Polyangiaceae bacterium]MCB9606645.1 serine protease [Polyangiaceae bacterium]
MLAVVRRIVFFPTSRRFVSKLVFGAGASALLLVSSCLHRGSTIGQREPASQDDERCKGDEKCLDACRLAERDSGMLGQCADMRQKVATLGAVPDDPVPAASEEPDWSRAGAARSHERLAAPELFSRALPSIVYIRTDLGAGTGFVVSAKGVIATNLHVIAGAKKIQAFLMNGAELKLKPEVAADPEHDVAALQTDMNVAPVALAHVNAVIMGQKVIVIGNPLGLKATLSEGIVSGVREMDDKTKVLQITAPISPGSSGGPIFNEYGEVIGISTFVILGGSNLGFGMPIRYLKELMLTPHFLSREEVAKLTPPHSSGDDAEPEEKSADASDLPLIQRDIPQHDVKLLKGCGQGDYRQIRDLIAEAVKVGAPLYNSKNFRACAQIYEGASSDLERSLAASCKGPKKALADGRKKASKQADDARRAWALRDSFDGLTRVIDKLEAQSKQ